MKPNKSVIVAKFMFFSFIALFIHCKPVDKQFIEDKNYITINAGIKTFDTGKELKLSSFVDTLEIIPLELTPRSMLREISKVVIHNNNILLIEERNAECVFRFDMKGNFLNTIGTKGQGPKEIVELADFCIDEENDIVFLYDRARQSVVSYELDGDFINSQNFGEYYSRIEFQKGFFYFFEDQPYTNDAYSLEIKDSGGRLRSHFFPSKRYKMSSSTKAFNKQSDQILFYRSMNDTIYAIKNDSLTYAYYIDFGPYKFTAEEVDDIYSERIRTMDLLANKERVSGVKSINKIKDFLFITTTYKIFNFTFIYDIKNGELETSGAYLSDDLYYMFYSNSFCGQTENALIGIHQPDDFKADIDYYDTLVNEGRITYEKKQELKNKMLTLAKGNIDEMNPWILLYHIKNKYPSHPKQE